MEASVVEVTVSFEEILQGEAYFIEGKLQVMFQEQHSTNKLFSSFELNIRKVF